MPWIAVGLVAVALGLASGCGFDRAAPGAGAEASTFDPSRDSFPFHAEFRHSRQLRVEYGRHHKAIRFTSRSLGETETWLLVRRGAPIPPGYSGAKTVAVPLASYAMLSFRYGGLIDALDVVDSLAAYANWKHAFAPKLVARIDSGAMSRNVSLELLASLEVGAVFDYYSNNELLRADDRYRDLGLVRIPLGEHLEPTPLARTEWIKAFAMFFDKEEQASRLFDGIEVRYESLRRVGAGAPSRPRVAMNAPVADAWPAPGGRNQLARLVEDAGGEYVWNDSPSPRSMERFGVERALDRSLDADVWIFSADMAGRPALDEWVAAHPLASRILAYSENRAFAAGQREDPGRSRYWDFALVEPDAELADHIRMIHPDLLPGHELALFRPLAKLGEAAGARREP